MRVGAAVVLGCTTFSLSFALFAIARSMEPGIAVYHFAAMVGGLIAGPCLGAVCIHRLVHGRLGRWNLVLGGALGAMTLYSIAILLFNFLGAAGSRCAIPRVYALAVWWSLAFVGPVLGVLIQPLTRSATTAYMLCVVDLMWTVFHWGLTQRWSLTSVASFAFTLTKSPDRLRHGRREFDDDGIHPLVIVVAFLTFAGPAALMLWAGGVCELPPYRRR